MPPQPSVRMKPTRGRIVKMNWVFRLAAELVLLLCIHQTVCGFGTEEQGPRFTVEPPVSVFFSNATGARIECAAEGTPQPLVRWQTVADGKTVADVLDVVRVEGNGTLIFLPFAEDLYSPDIHSAAYRCVAHSRAGTIVSRSVFVRAEVVRDFEPVVRDTVTMPGNVAVFSCIIPGVDYNGSDGPPDSVAITSWVQDGVFNIFPSWEIDSKIIMVPKSGNLRIGNVDENDLRHSYTCRIVNKLTGFTQESGANGRIYFESNRTLAPWSKSPVFTLHLVKQGEHLLLPCDVYGFPPPQVSWTSGTSADQEFSEPPAGVEKKKYPMNFFRLRSVQKSDAGNYTCTASNVAGHLRLHHRVIVIPDMSAQVVPSHYEIEAGRSTSFTCITSSNDENQIVTWLKNGEPRKSTSSTPPTYTLNIDSVQKHDQGIYQCVVTNKLNNEMAQSFAELRLSATKPVFKYKFIGHLVEPSAEVTLKCIAYGTPPPQISWKVDGFDVAQSQTRVAVSQYVTEVGEVISHFNITKVQVEDGGMYECVATNRAGMVSHSAKLQVHGNPVAKKSPKIIARAGQQLQINCPVSGYPIVYVNWEKDNKKLPGLKLTNKRYKVFNNGSIIIDNVQKKTDQGTYYCEASNDNHVAKASVEVVVIEPPHIHPFTIEDGYHEGGRVGCQCFITKGDGPLSIQWLKNNQTLDSAASVPPLSVTYQNEYSSSLLIESIRLSHEGNYTCRATNPVATVEHTVTLTVLVPPEWISEPKDMNVIRDDEAEINCSASGHPKPNIKWRKGTSKDSDQFTEVTDNVTSEGTLIINRVTKKHEGFYMCEANNDVGQPISAVIRLSVQDLPHIILPNTKYTSVNGGEVTMSCEATGDQPIHISWIKGSTQLNYKSNIPRYTVEEMYTDMSVRSKLTIKKVSATDSGRYVCVAENSLGKHEAAMELEIKVLGSPPDDLTCNETTPTSIRLRWTDLNANSPMSDHIQGYVVTYSRVVPPDDLINEYDEIEVFQSGDDVIISDLDTDTAYEFTIRVNTIQGPGKSSKPLICKTSESLPGPPAALKAMRMSPTTALITWIPPKNPNGKIKRYTLYEREILNGMQGVLKSQLYDHTIRQVQLSMFRDTVSYLWWVSATNDEGEGVKSHTATLSAAKSSGIPASIGTFSDTVQTKWHTDVDLPCIVSGIPTPNVKWTRDGQPIELHSQSKVYENFTLHLASVTSSDTGNYTCTAWNVYGSDVVSTDLLVVEPPKPPILGVMSTSWTNITVKWTKAPDTYAIQQYLLSYKYVNELDNMYTEVALSSRTNMFTLPNIKCGTTVAFSISASNRVGHGMQSRPFHVKTLQGQTPLAPSQEEAIEEMVSGILIHLQKWDGKHCPITHFNIFKRQPFEKDWTAVGENVAPTEIYSIDNLKPSTHYNILVKSFNSAGMTSTVYAVSTISPYGEKTNKRALSVNDKIMNVIYNIAGMWHYGIIVLCFITIGLTALMCIKYRHLYNKNNSERHLESNTMALKNTNCSRPQSPLEAYEPCASTHFKPKNTMVNNVESNYNEISPYATFQIAQEKSHPINKNYFCTSCANNADHCTCSRIYTPQFDYANYTMRSLSKRGNTFSDGAEDFKSHNGSLHEFYDMERVSNTCEQVKKPKRRLLPLPDARRITSQSSRDFRNPNLHETTFTMPIQHEMYRRDQNVVSDEENLEPMCSSNNIRPYIQRGCY